MATARYAAGQWVRHEKLGLGLVIDTDETSILARFQDSEQRRLVQCTLP